VTLIRPNLTGQVAVVTGASAGIGRDTAIRLTELGATVVGCARDATRMRDLGFDARRCDVSVAADRAALIEGVLADHGRVDILVNNAGIGIAKLVEQMGVEDVDRLIATNCTGLVDLSRLVLPGMVDRRSGHIINISSGGAWWSMPPYSVYCATKYFVDGFTEGLRREVLSKRVKVHSVNPGPVRTEWLSRSMGWSPTEGEAERRDEPGVPVSWVVNAIVRCLVRPYGRTASVPRIPIGLARLLGLPVLRQGSDIAGAITASRLRPRG
jgi:NADP-dependent 3-hydroxy acid dehydrogenase YdfG